MALTGDNGIACPVAIEVEQKLISETNAWTVQSKDLSQPLAGVKVFNGPLERKEIIVPKSVIEGKETVDHYFDATPSEDIWIECAYLNTTITLVRNIGRPNNCTSRKKSSPIPKTMFECENGNSK